MPFTLFDLAVVLVIVASTLLAMFRGLAREALTVLAWAGAIAIAWYGFEAVQGVAQQTIDTPWLADTAALIVVFVVPLILLKIVAAVLAEQIPTGWVGRVDRSAGALFGAARGFLIVAAGYLVMGLVMSPEQQPGWVRDARLLPYVQDAARLLQGVLPEPAEPGDGAAAALSEQEAMGA